MAERQPYILVVDDEEQIRRALKSVLALRKYEVEAVESAEDGLDSLAERQPDLIVLDLTLPGMSGLEFCRTVREWSDVPILVLSVRDSEQDKISALEIGADDYLTKPFSAGELLARVAALLRRAAGAQTAPVVATGELVIDLAKRRVTVRGEEVKLTPIEYGILAVLVRNIDCVVTSRMILEKVWGSDYADDTQTLRVHISHLRKKIEPHPAVPRYIITEPGVGFRFSPGQDFTQT